MRNVKLYRTGLIGIQPPTPTTLKPHTDDASSKSPTFEHRGSRCTFSILWSPAEDSEEVSHEIEKATPQTWPRRALVCYTV